MELPKFKENLMTLTIRNGRFAIRSRFKPLYGKNYRNPVHATVASGYVSPMRDFSMKIFCTSTEAATRTYVFTVGERISPRFLKLNAYRKRIYRMRARACVCVFYIAYITHRRLNYNIRREIENHRELL